MKKLTWMIVVLAVVLSAVGAQAAHPARDWARYMPLPTEEQLAQAGTSRSPYIAFYPGFSRKVGITAYAMDFRIDHDPDSTYMM